MNNKNKGMILFLKWAGGKQWLIKKYDKIFPECFNQYYEPFVGGGAVFFSLMPEHAILSDINEEIINLYLVMRDCPSELRKTMQNHQRHHSKEYYYHIRSKKCSNKIDRAAMQSLVQVILMLLYHVQREMI